jgi:hypothetical protein
MASPSIRARYPEGRPGGSARAIATYLVSVRPLLQEVTDSRRAFIRHIGLLMEEARQASRAVVVQAAGRIGRDEGAGFRSLLAQIDGIAPPAGCEPCHSALVRWVELHLAACSVMVDVGTSGDLARLRETQQLLGNARLEAQRFNGEYGRLVTEVRQRVRAATAADKRRRHAPLRFR